MSRPIPIQFPSGIRPVVATPVDWLSGPYTGNTIQEAINAANLGVTMGSRFRSLEVRLLVGANTYKYWYYGGTADSDLVEFSPNVPVFAAGPNGSVQFNDGNAFSGNANLSYSSANNQLVLGTNTAIAFGDGTTQATARNFYGLTGATSARFPVGLSSAGNTGDRLLIATGPSTDPFRSYVRFGKGWFQTGIVGIGQGPQGIQGITGERGSTGEPGERGATGQPGERGPTGEPGERGATGSFTGDFVSELNGLTGSITIAGGTNVSVNVEGSTITILASGGSAETTWGRTDPVTTTVGGVASGSTFDVATNAIAVLHKMLYPYQEVSFTSFLIGLGFVREFDLGTTSPANNYTASWSGQTPLANWVSGSISISRTSPSSSTLLSGLSIGDSPRSIAHPTYRYTTPTALQFQISGQQVQGSNPRTAFDTYNWKARIYYGKSSKDTLNSSYSTYSSFAAEFPFTGLAGVFTSQNTVLGARTITWADTSPTGQHYWLFTPNVIPQFGQYVNFKDPNNLQVTPEITGNIVIANQNGLTMDYIYYRWGFPTEGIVTLTVS